MPPALNRARRMPVPDQTAGRRSERMRREPRVATMYSVAARGTSGDRELGVPGRAAVVDARGAVGVPGLHAHRLPDIERGLRRRRRACEPPAVRDDRQRDAQDAGNRELHRQRGADAKPRRRRTPRRRRRRADRTFPSGARRRRAPRQRSTRPIRRSSLALGSDRLRSDNEPASASANKPVYPRCPIDGDAPRQRRSHRRDARIRV